MRVFRKRLTNVMALILSAIMLFAFGCGGKVVQEYDSSKTQIFVYYIDGDTQVNWLKQAANDFNALPDNSEYQVVPISTTNDQYETMLSSKGGPAHAYLTTSSSLATMIDGGSIADLSSILTMEVDNGTVANKFQDLDSYKALYSTKTNKGLYAVPLSTTPMHIIFDFDLFKDNGWLIYQTDEHGDIIRGDDDEPKLSVGHDGKEGTYDDGQPVNVEEWETMMDRISKADDTKAFLYSTKYDFYIEQPLQSLIAQYGGFEAYQAFVNGYGSYYDKDGNIVNVDLSEGYKVYEMPAIEQAITFMAKWMVKDEKYVHEKSWDTTETSHRDAQQTFVTGYDTRVQQAAFLVEGAYWEIGLKSYFDLLVKRGDSDRGYGKRNFRYMLFPRFNDYSDVSYITSTTTGSMIVSNDKNSALLEKTKEFVAFTLQDKYLQQYTLDTGVKRPFDYSLTSPQMSQLTPFQSTTFEMLSDTENVKLITEADTAQGNPEVLGHIKFNKKGYTFASTMPDGEYQRPLGILRRYSAQEFAQGLLRFKTSQWQTATFYD